MKLCSCEETTLRDLHFLDSPQMHIAILGCNGVHVKNLTITAPELSPNTDGIHIQSSDNVTINDTVIGTGKIKIFFVPCYYNQSRLTSIDNQQATIVFPSAI